MTAAQMLRKLLDPAADEAARVEGILQRARPAIPLDRALLCLDCEVLFEAEGDQRCPACGSEVAWAVGRALNREPQ